MASRTAIPVFRLYGEAGDAMVPGFVHVERISSRAPLHGWTIGAHRHALLSQALLVTSGKGVQRADEREIGFAAPWLIWVPSGSVHGFAFAPGTEGFVVTMADDFLATAIRNDPEAARLRDVTDEAFSGAMGEPEEIDIALRTVFEALHREAAAAYPGARSATLALVKLLLVGLVRTRAARTIDGAGAEARASLYRRYRKLVETHICARIGAWRATPASSASPPTACTPPAPRRSARRRSASCTTACCSKPSAA